MYVLYKFLDSNTEKGLINLKDIYSYLKVMSLLLFASVNCLLRPPPIFESHFVCSVLYADSGS